MILTELRKVIDRNFRNETFMDAMRYSQGFLDGVKNAPKYGILSSADWQKLNRYVIKKCKEKLELQCSTKKIMERIKRENN